MTNNGATNKHSVFVEVAELSNWSTPKLYVYDFDDQEAALKFMLAIVKSETTKEAKRAWPNGMVVHTYRRHGTYDDVDLNEVRFLGEVPPAGTMATFYTNNTKEKQ